MDRARSPIRSWHLEMTTVLISQSTCKNTVRTEFKIQSKLSHLVHWVKAQTSSEVQPPFSQKVIFKHWTQLCYRRLVFCCLVLVGFFFKSLFKTQSKLVQKKCADPGPLQQLPIYRKQYWTNKSDFNACQWLSQSRRQSKVPKNISKYTALLTRT